VAFNSRSKTEVTAQLKLGKGAAERNSAKATEAKLRRVPNMNTSKNAVLAVVAAVASMGFFSGQLRFSEEKVQTRTASPVS
jgi:hypothetical protein